MSKLRLPFDNGALFVDKPAGMTSAEVVRKVKYKFEVSKIGHAGTLDPMATGLLVILFGKGTRLQDILSRQGKVYEGQILFGQVTDTDDISGELLEEYDTVSILQGRTHGEIESELELQFIGRQQQVPPIYSAVKVSGNRSYALARKGQAPKLKPKSIEIFELKIEFLSRDTLSYRLRCSPGTYVRSLARDIGSYLGCGGTLKSIRRVGDFGFSVDKAVPFEEFCNWETDFNGCEQVFVSLEELVNELPRIVLSNHDCSELFLGKQQILHERLADCEQKGFLAVFDEFGVFRSLAERDENSQDWRLRFAVC